MARLLVYIVFWFHVSGILAFKQNILSVALLDCYSRGNQIGLTQTNDVVDISKCLQENLAQLLLGSHVNTINQLKVNPIDLEQMHVDGYPQLWNNYLGRVPDYRKMDQERKRQTRATQRKFAFAPFEGPKGGEFDRKPIRTLEYRKSIVDPRTTQDLLRFSDRSRQFRGPVIRRPFRKSIIDQRTLPSNITSSRKATRKNWKDVVARLRNRDKERFRKKRSTRWRFQPFRGPTGGIFNRKPIIRRRYRPSIVDPRTYYGPYRRLPFRKSIVDPRTRGKRSLVEEHRIKRQSSTQPSGFEPFEGPTGGEFDRVPERGPTYPPSTLIDLRTPQIRRQGASGERLVEPPKSTGTSSDVQADKESNRQRQLNRIRTGSVGQSDTTKSVQGAQSDLTNKQSSQPFAFAQPEGPTGGEFDRLPVRGPTFSPSTHNDIRTPQITGLATSGKNPVLQSKKMQAINRNRSGKGLPTKTLSGKDVTRNRKLYTKKGPGKATTGNRSGKRFRNKNPNASLKQKVSNKNRAKRFAKLIHRESFNSNQPGSVMLPFKTSITDPTTGDKVSISIDRSDGPKQEWINQQQQILGNLSRFRWLDTINTAFSKFRREPFTKWVKPGRGFDYQLSKDLIDPRTM